MASTGLNVFMHEDVNASRLLLTFKTISEVEETVKCEVRRVLNLPNEPWSNYVPRSSPSRPSSAPGSGTEDPSPSVPPPALTEVCIVGTLPVNGGISMMHALAEYDASTRCHMYHQLDKMHATLVWLRAIRFAARCLLPPSAPNSHRRRSCLRACPLDGVFLVCTHIAFYTVGLITSAATDSAILRDLCADFACAVGDGMPFSEVAATVPLCASLRCVSLTLWWTPQATRVVPRVPLPCVKVILKERQRGWPAPHDHSPSTSVVAATVSEVATPTRDESAAGAAEEVCEVFKGYSLVRLFLARPFASSLTGSLVWPVPHDISLARDALQAHSGNPDASTGVVSAPPVADTTQPYEEEGTRASLPRLAYFAVNGKYRAVAHLLFTDAAVSQTGEHLIGVEVTVEDAYKPFVPVLCSHLAPFLVVSSPDA